MRSPKAPSARLLPASRARGSSCARCAWSSYPPSRRGAFYAVHQERPFYGELVEFMTSGPAVPMVLARADAVAHLRDFIGPTNSLEAPAGTIRGDFGTDVQCNAVHASDSAANAESEIAFFFAD